MEVKIMRQRREDKIQAGHRKISCKFMDCIHSTHRAQSQVLVNTAMNIQVPQFSCLPES